MEKSLARLAKLNGKGKINELILGEAIELLHAMSEFLQGKTSIRKVLDEIVDVYVTTQQFIEAHQLKDLYTLLIDFKINRALVELGCTKAEDEVESNEQ